MPVSPSPIPLRFGDYGTRWWAGVWLIVGGGILIAGANTFALWALGVGTLAHVAGWCVLPVAGWRRMLAVGPSTLIAWLLLSGPQFIVVLVVPYLCGLLVRALPGWTALSAIPVAVAGLAIGIAIGQVYERMLLALGAMGFVMVLVGAATSALAAWVRGRKRPVSG